MASPHLLAHGLLSPSHAYACVPPVSLDQSGGTVSAKIGDFGLSRRTAEQTSMTALIGTIQYI